jgi:hypothetical protein
MWSPLNTQTARIGNYFYQFYAKMATVIAKKVRKNLPFCSAGILAAYGNGTRIV